MVDPLLLLSQPGPIQLHLRITKPYLSRTPWTLRKDSTGWSSSILYVYGKVFLSPLHEVVVEDVVEPVCVGDTSRR